MLLGSRSISNVARLAFGDVAQVLISSGDNFDNRRSYFGRINKCGCFWAHNQRITSNISTERGLVRQFVNK